MTDMADPNVSDAWVGRDIDRAPGGDSKVYQSNCRSCHGIMDGFRGAFAHFNNSNYLPEVSRPPVESAYRIQVKYARNSEFYPAGHVTKDDSFENLATTGSNAEFFGWRGPTRGNGAAQFGMMLSKSKAFSRCMVKRAVEAVCLKTPSFEETLSMVYPEADRLEADQYNLRRMFGRIASNPNCINPEQGK